MNKSKLIKIIIINISSNFIGCNNYQHKDLNDSNNSLNIDKIVQSNYKSNNKIDENTSHQLIDLQFDNNLTFVWSGKNFKDYSLFKKPTFRETLQAASNNFEVLFPKDEFEKTNDFEKRKSEYNYRIAIKLGNVKSDILNDFLGTQNFNMQYDADSEKFNIRFDFFSFDMNVSIDIAREFKANINDFNIFFKEKNNQLIIVGAETFLNDRNFSTNLYINVEELINSKIKKEVKTEAYQNDFNPKIIDSSDENEYIWIDPKTKMTWINLPISAQDKQNYDEDKEGGQVWNYNNAIKYCDELEFAGYSDWHLPTLTELSTLILKRKNQWLYIKKGLVDNFELAHGGKYDEVKLWSLTINKEIISQSFIFYLNNGNYESKNNITTYYVRCVR